MLTIQSLMVLYKDYSIFFCLISNLDFKIMNHPLRPTREAERADTQGEPHAAEAALLHEPKPQVLTRTEMREKLLEPGIGVCGMVYHVGSDPSDPENGFENVVKRELMQHGFLSWLQGKNIVEVNGVKVDLEDMNFQPNYHPELGFKLIAVDQGIGREKTVKIDFDMEQITAFQQAVESSEGIDFHEDAAHGWYFLLEKAPGLKHLVRVLKTHFASPSCSAKVLTENAKAMQADLYRAEVRGHLKKAREISSIIIVSIDDPNPFGEETLRDNLRIMFNDEFDGERVLVSTGEEVLRAIHSCGQWNIFDAMESQAVDVVHWNARLYPDILLGKNQALKDYIERKGMFAWGGIPQDYDNLLALGRELKITDKDLNSIKSSDEYIPIAQQLNTHVAKAQKIIFNNYIDWLSKVSAAAKVDKLTLARQTFVSATCGYGSNAVPELRKFSYELGRRVATQAFLQLISENFEKIK